MKNNIEYMRKQNKNKVLSHFSAGFLKRAMLTNMFVLLMAGSTLAQPQWSVYPYQYQYSMTFTTVLLISSKESRDTSDMIAAFVGEECRGVAQPIQHKSSIDKYVAFLMVYSNNIEGDTLTFQLYNHDQDTVLSMFNHVPFEPNAVYGSPSEPLYNLVEKEITAYNFFSPNQDMRNDTWVIEHRPLYLDFEVSIYNNIGERLYNKTEDYQNDWEGTYKGTDVPQGTYYYIVKSPGEQFVYKGTISLIR